MELFLDLNGQELTADDAALVGTILSLAAPSLGDDTMEGQMEEPALADWLRQNCRDKE